MTVKVVVKIPLTQRDENGRFGVKVGVVLVQLVDAFCQCRFIWFVTIVFEFVLPGS